jgi:hypothetical protein
MIPLFLPVFVSRKVDLTDGNGPPWKYCSLSCIPFDTTQDAYRRIFDGVLNVL